MEQDELNFRTWADNTQFDSDYERSCRAAWMTASHIKQAEIDRLMIEFCPKEMTKEQTANWYKHQVPTK